MLERKRAEQTTVSDRQRKKRWLVGRVEKWQSPTRFEGEEEEEGNNTELPSTIIGKNHSYISAHWPKATQTQKHAMEKVLFQPLAPLPTLLSLSLNPSQPLTHSHTHSLSTSLWKRIAKLPINKYQHTAQNNRTTEQITCSDGSQLWCSVCKDAPIVVRQWLTSRSFKSNCARNKSCLRFFSNRRWWRSSFFS